MTRSMAAAAGLSVARAGELWLPGAWAYDETGASDFSPVPPDLGQPPFGAGAYWRFADWLQPYFDRHWQSDHGHYGSGNSAGGRIYHNSLLLTVHAVAALTGHQGPSRKDDRARILAKRLCDAPPWSELSEPLIPSGQFHTPGWVESLGTSASSMDKSIDPKVAEALMYAWRARAALGLPQETVNLIKDRVSRCARGPFFRYPSVRLNQINWNCELYSHNATVNGDPELLVNDYRAQVVRFCEGIKRPLVEGGSPNLGPGYKFFYLPERPPDHPFNLDSAEYANETAHFILYYEQALSMGMPPISDEHMTLLRAWVEHIVCGYWTHGGYLNWDTGYGFKRWHAGRTWAFAIQGLLAIAASPRFHNDPKLGEWAKYFLDRTFILYERLSAEAPDKQGIAPSVLYDISVAPLGPSIRDLTVARMMANAARAVALGLGGKPAPRPPALWSYDPDIGRLAITTRTYNTAVLATNQHAIPYGGVEMARFYDQDQRVAANVGGLPWASFGVIVRDMNNKAVMSSQRPRSEPSNPPVLEILRSPRGKFRRTRSYPPRPYAGAFRSLVVRGSTGNKSAAVKTTHRFKSRSIETSWRITRKAAGRYKVDVLFPSWGRKATIDAVLRGGRRFRLAKPNAKHKRILLRKVAYFHIHGEDGSGYVVVPKTRPRPARAHILPPKKQSSAPNPGPTLAIGLTNGARFRRLGFAARIAPAGDAREAAKVARQLRKRR